VKTISIFLALFSIVMVFKAYTDFLFSLPVPVDLRESRVEEKESVLINNTEKSMTDVGHVAIVNKEGNTNKTKDASIKNNDGQVEIKGDSKTIKVKEFAGNPAKPTIKKKDKISDNSKISNTKAVRQTAPPEKSTLGQVENIKARNGVDPMIVFWVKVAFSSFFGLSAMFVVLINRYDNETKKWAFSVLTLIAGVWIGSVT